MAEEEWRKWVPVISRLLWQCYYRLLSFVSYHGPIDESYEAAKYLSIEKMGEQVYGGDVYWVVEGHVFRWDNVEVSPGITMSLWFVGSAVLRKNTIMARRGWWSLYMLQATRALRSEFTQGQG
jgi:hypothetical protein